MQIAEIGADSVLTAPAVTKLDFRLLGPLEVHSHDGELSLGGRKQKAVLALLLLGANEVVPADRVIADIWGADAPPSAKATLHAYISRLRRALGGRIETVDRGYRIRVDSSELDRGRFERLADLGHEALVAGNPELALTRLREALELWRGEPLADVPLGPAADIEIARLEELRMAVLEEQNDAKLALGRHREAIDELEALVGRHPFHERLREQLMLALYRSGRQADALALYRATRELFVSTLGIEPSRSIQELHRSMLGQDPMLDLPAQVEGGSRLARRRATLLHVSFALQPSGDAEVANQTLSRLADISAEILERHQARVERRVGEGVIGVFGLPATHEEDLLRALRAATELRNSLPALARFAIESGDILADGDAVLGGEALARVIELKERAGRGEILVGETARRLARRVARLEPAGAEDAWRLLDIDAGAEAIQRHFDGELIGRELELDRLEQAFNAAVGRDSCRLLTVVGAPGVGKSRLARELTDRIGTQATVLEGRCLSYGEGITLWPLEEMVQQLAGNARRKTLEALLEGETNASIIAAQLATALGSDETGEAGEDTFWAVRKLFEAVARRRPVVLVFDDVHWAKTRMLDLIEHLVDLSRDAPILVVCLARLEFLSEKPTWGGGKPNAASLLLSPLSEAESRALVERRARSLGRGELDAIVARAEGNPLFIEQLLALREEKGPRSELGMPLTIQAVLTARLDALEEAERLVLDCGSIVGLEFLLGACADLTGQSVERLEELIPRLVERELLRPARSDVPGERAFRFQHQLIRDSAYESVPKVRRAELHERFASWLEAASGIRLDSDEIIGYHLEHAYRYRTELDPDSDKWNDLAEAAGDHYRKAATVALSRSDAMAASGLLERALALWPRGHSSRGSTLVDASLAYRHVGQRRKAKACIEEAIQIARASNDLSLEAELDVASLERRLAEGSCTVGDILEQSDELLGRLVKTGEYRPIAQLRIIQAWAMALLGREAEAEQALQDVLGLGNLDPRLRLRALRLLPSLWQYGPTPVIEAIAKCEQLLASQSTPREIASIQRCLAGLWAMRGEFERARLLYSQQETALSDLGLVINSAATASVRGTVELLANDVRAAERVLRRAIRQLKALGRTLYLPDVAAVLARALYEKGDHDEAWRYSDLSTGPRSHDIAVPVLCRGVRAKILAHRDHGQEAVRLSTQAIAMANDTDLPDLQADAYFDLGDVLQTTGDLQDASSAFRQALVLYEQKGNDVSAARVRTERLNRLP